MYIILAHKSIILTTHALSLSLKFASAGSMCKRGSRGGGGGGPHPPPPLENYKWLEVLVQTLLEKKF